MEIAHPKVDRQMKIRCWISLIFVLLITDLSLLQAQQTLKDAKLEVDERSLGIPFEGVSHNNGCKVQGPLILKGKATGPISGDFQGSIDRFVVMKSGGGGEFKATVIMKTNGGEIVIRNHGYTEAQRPQCLPMAADGSIGPHGAVMTFKFSTQYQATVPRGNGHGDHVCGKATIDGQFEWHRHAMKRKRYCLEIVNSEGQCTK